jgi:hypothetical protein
LGLLWGMARAGLGTTALGCREVPSASWTYYTAGLLVNSGLSQPGMPR